MRVLGVALLALLTASASAQPPIDAGTGERSVPLTWVLDGAPSAEHGSEWTGGELVVRGGTVVVRRPRLPDLRCDEIARRDRTADAGDEIVYGPRWRMRLRGGGEDGSYTATYGVRGTRFVRVAMRYVESTY